MKDTPKPVECSRCLKIIGAHDPAVRLHATDPKRMRHLCYDCYIQWILAGRPEPFPTIMIK